ncbi:hypothetical protein MMC29_001304 [Sticta canariensis]|nr:hypothetical protein [Sticta canariensis]
MAGATGALSLAHISCLLKRSLRTGLPRPSRQTRYTAPQHRSACDRLIRRPSLHDLRCPGPRLRPVQGLAGFFQGLRAQAGQISDHLDEAQYESGAADIEPDSNSAISEGQDANAEDRLCQAFRDSQTQDLRRAPVEAAESGLSFALSAGPSQDLATRTHDPAYAAATALPPPALSTASMQQDNNKTDRLPSAGRPPKAQSTATHRKRGRKKQASNEQPIQRMQKLVGLLAVLMPKSSRMVPGHQKGNTLAVSHLTKKQVLAYLQGTLGDAQPPYGLEGGWEKYLIGDAAIPVPHAWDHMRLIISVPRCKHEDEMRIFHAFQI